MRNLWTGKKKQKKTLHQQEGYENMNIADVVVIKTGCLCSNTGW